MWYVTGYGIAMGKDTFPTSGDNGFIGTDSFLLTTGTFRGAGPDVGYNWAFWLFQWAFAATTATSENPLLVSQACSNQQRWRSGNAAAVTQQYQQR